MNRRERRRYRLEVRIDRVRALGKLPRAQRRLLVAAWAELTHLLHDQRAA